MGIITKEVEIKPRGTQIAYYRNLGYDAEYSKPIIVKTEHLPPFSNVSIQCECDYCGKIRTIKYKDYTASTKIIDKYACSDCGNKKFKDVCYEKYSVDNPMKLDQVKTKFYDTMEDRYGVRYALKNDECKKKQEQTCLERFGTKYPSSLPEIQEKVKDTFLKNWGQSNPMKSDAVKKKFRNSFIEKYGVDNPMYVKEFKDNQTNTFLKKYGVTSPAKNSKIKEKMVKTMYKDNSQKTSSQQRYINDLYHGTLNYPIKHYNADIAFPNEKFLVEYNGGGHWLNVETGRMTKEEFNQKEIIRNNIIKREGWKQITIISRKDNLPSDQKLLELFSHSRNFFKENPERSWIEFDIDNSTMRNALCKDNAEFYDFGDLRKLPRNSQSA